MTPRELSDQGWFLFLEGLAHDNPSLIKAGMAAMTRAAVFQTYGVPKC